MLYIEGQRVVEAAGGELAQGTLMPLPAAPDRGQGGGRRRGGGNRR
jgi:hypothetical protein